MAFTCPPHLRDEWRDYLKMRQERKEKGTADGNFNIVYWNKLKEIFHPMINKDAWIE